MSGQWRVTVDSWISKHATWYGRRTFVLDGDTIHNLHDAIQAVADGDVRDLLGEHRLHLNDEAPPYTNFPAPEAVLDHMGDPPAHARPSYDQLLQAINDLWGNAEPADLQPETRTVAQWVHEEIDHHHPDD